MREVLVLSGPAGQKQKIEARQKAPSFIHAYGWKSGPFAVLGKESTIPANSFVPGLRLHGELKTGDVNIFRHEGKLLVKRIAATEGESVEHNGEVHIVPSGCYYVLGDNAEDSLDSRFWEEPFVSREEVVGKVMLLSF